jgi:hypothetical protein
MSQYTKTIDYYKPMAPEKVTYLGKADCAGHVSEASTAEIHVVLSDHTVAISAAAAANTRPRLIRSVAT